MSEGNNPLGGVPSRRRSWGSWGRFTCQRPNGAVPQWTKRGRAPVLPFYTLVAFCQYNGRRPRQPWVRSLRGRLAPAKYTLFDRRRARLPDTAASAATSLAPGVCAGPVDCGTGPKRCPDIVSFIPCLREPVIPCLRGVTGGLAPGAAISGDLPPSAEIRSPGLPSAGRCAADGWCRTTQKIHLSKTKIGRNAAYCHYTHLCFSVQIFVEMLSPVVTRRGRGMSASLSPIVRLVNN